MSVLLTIPRGVIFVEPPHEDLLMPVKLALMGLVLVALAFCSVEDLRTGRVPNMAVLMVVGLAALYGLLIGNLLPPGAGFAGGLLMVAILIGGYLLGEVGGADVKLGFGIALTLPTLLGGLFVLMVAAGLHVVVSAAWTRLGVRRPSPFVPQLAIGLILYLGYLMSQRGLAWM